MTQDTSFILIYHLTGDQFRVAVPTWHFYHLRWLICSTWSNDEMPGKTTQSKLAPAVLTGRSTSRVWFLISSDLFLKWIVRAPITHIHGTWYDIMLTYKYSTFLELSSDHCIRYNPMCHVFKTIWNIRSYLKTWPEPTLL